MVIRAVVREKVWIFQCSEKLFSYIVAYLIELGQLNTGYVNSRIEFKWVGGVKAIKKRL